MNPHARFIINRDPWSSPVNAGVRAKIDARICLCEPAELALRECAKTPIDSSVLDDYLTVIAEWRCLVFIKTVNRWPTIWGAHLSDWNASTPSRLVNCAT